MLRAIITLILASLVAPTAALNMFERDSLPDFSDSITSSLPWCQDNMIAIKAKRDTITIRRYQRENINDTIHLCEYILPLSHIQSVYVRPYNDNTHELMFLAMSDRKGFYTECHLEEFRSYGIPMLEFHTDANDSSFFKSIHDKIHPYLFEYQPDCSFIDKAYISMDTFIEGIEDYKLVTKSRINGSDKKDSIVVELIRNALPEWVKTPRFKYMYITLLVNKIDTITYYSLANYGMYLEYKSYDPTLVIDDNSHIHNEPRGGFVNDIENQELEKLIRSQNWQAGRCDGQKVDTIITLILSLNQ